MNVSNSINASKQPRQPHPRAASIRTPRCALCAAAVFWALAHQAGGPGPLRAAEAQTPVPARVQSLDGAGWLLATDPRNEGREQRWFEAPRPGAKAATVPWIIQDPFPGYHGVAWYWRDFVAPENPHADGRWVLRFWAVDYRADVWLNGRPAGGHEGGEGVFELDVTAGLKPGQTNRLAVRVLNPKDEPIDGYVLRETPARNKVVRYSAGSSYDHGGIVDSVELLAAAPVRCQDVFARPDWRTGIIRVRASVRNAGGEKRRTRLQFSAAPAMSGETLETASVEIEAAPGEQLAEAELRVGNPRLWELNDSWLYRVTVRVQAEGSASFDELSTRCGFRDFRFANGYFRLNGKRLFLRCSHTGNHCPVGLQFPPDPDLLRRDLVNVKAMGFNAIRFIAGVPTRRQLDLCDELGLMVYEECYAGWCLWPSPRMPERYDRSIAEMIRRDRNHPSVIMWGMLNETEDNPVFRRAFRDLPLVRGLDDTRVVMLNGGRFDGRTGQGRASQGLEIWKSTAGPDPNVTHNPTDHDLSGPGVRWSPAQLAFHPGPNGEYSVVRWTPPIAGECEFSARFTGIAGKTTTDVHVTHNGRSLYDGLINVGGAGNEATTAFKATVAPGDQVDFSVGFGNGNYGGDTTALAVSIRTPDGQIHEAAAGFSLKANPNGAWSYGSCAPGKAPNPASFKRYVVAEKVGDDPDVIGSLSNPGSTVWEDVVGDKHPYLRTPLRGDVIRAYRTMDGELGKPVFISEYGVGSAVDLVRTVRHYERWGKEGLEDALFYRDKLDRFLADWTAWKMAEVFGRPEEFFAASQKKMAGERSLGTSAIRANPKSVGYSLTGTVDQGMTGEGLFTTWRELKEGTVDAMFDAWAPLRWCLFVEPVNVYRGSRVRCDAVLANEDQLKPGVYPARVQVFGPNNQLVWEKCVPHTVSAPGTMPEPPFATQLVSEEITVEGPPGRYRLCASFDRGAAPVGREAVFYVAERGAEPALQEEVVLWGEDPRLVRWCEERRVRTRPWVGAQTGREIILMGARAPEPRRAAFAELARHVARGSAALALAPEVFAEDKDSGRWLPLPKKGALKAMGTWLYHKDEWARSHPAFDGLPTGMLDYVFYRDLVPDHAWSLSQTPTVVICGANDASLGYDSGVMLAAQDFGAGRFVFNTLYIRDNLGTFPPADRLVLNLIRWFERGLAEPLAELPSGWEAELRALGY